MRLWQKLWLLFTVIWVVVAGLNVFTILAFSEGAEQEKAFWPSVLAVVVPVALYVIGWVWEKLSKKPGA